jgi:hypothetical protein
MVYGCSEDELKTPPPVINDYALKMEDVFDKDVEYDEDDL